MAQTFKSLRKYVPRIALSLGASSLAFAPAFAQATTPETGIADALVKILAVIAVAGAGYITVSLASVGWSVGAKFIKRLGGKA